jgi:hypothetical protein
LVVPAWTVLYLAFAPSLKLSGRARLVPPATVLAASVAVAAVFALSTVPMTGASSKLAAKSWHDVADQVTAPGVRTLYIDMANAAAMPDAAAIADEAVRHGLRVEVNRAALYFLDPSFAPRAEAQMEVVVCCGRGDKSRRPQGMDFRGRVGGQRIYVSTCRFVVGRPALTRAACDRQAQDGVVG